MIIFEEALQFIQSQSINIGTEHIALATALNRVLAEDAISDIDMPPFHKSAMDGYACCKTDLNNELDIIEEIPAGAIPTKSVGKNQCSRIMTGAMIPEGADFILMKEHVQKIGSKKIKRIKESANANICYQGEDVKTGDIIVRKGDLLKPQHIATLASAGVMMPNVYLQPNVAIISTGNELVEPDIKPGISQIRNSNGLQLFTQTIQMGLKPEYMGIVPDNEAALHEKLDHAINKYQAVLISGGVSVGDYDFIPKVLKHLGAEIVFHGIMAKPGKHLLFGRKNNCFIFGLPGNPVSSFIQFDILVKPFLYKLMGTNARAITIQIPIDEAYTRKKSDVLSFIPIAITDNGTALPLEYHGSAHIHSFTKANGIMEIPLGTNEIKKGEIVRVRPL